MSEKFRLSAAERKSELWQRLLAHYEARLVKHRATTENIATPDRERLIAAVRVNEIKEFLALGAPEPPTDAG